VNTEEKLQHFYDLSIQSAKEDAQKVIDAQQNTLDHMFEEHVDTKNRQAEAELKAESDKLKRDFNKDISAEQLKIKRQLSEAQDTLKDKLFLEVSEKLKSFKEMPEYKDVLSRQVKDAVDFADGDEMIIYIDPSDEKYLDFLKEQFNDSHISINLSKEIFNGGIRAVIRSKNILIDDSFLNLVSDAKEKFTFDGRA